MTTNSNGAAELFLIDGSSFLFRAYHQSINQDPRYNVRAADGLPTGAVRLFMAKMLQILEKGAAGIVPTHVVVAFDVSRQGWRRDIFPGYKSSRSEAPIDLKPQMPYMRHAIAAIGMRSVEMEGYEADDIIATYARLGVEAGMTVTLLSADKDIMQLVRDGVRFFDFESGTPGKPGYRPERNFDWDAVREFWEGIPPELIPDAQALLGDDADDIPGVKGIGIKTAAELLANHGSVEAIIRDAASIPQKKRRELIVDNVETIRMSRRLALLDDNVPVENVIEDFCMPLEFDSRRAVAFAKALDFPAIVKRLAKLGRIDANLVAPDPDLAAAAKGGAVDAAPIVRANYSVTGQSKMLVDWLREARASGMLAVVPLQEGGVLLGVGIAVAPGRATYVPVGHEETGTLFGGRYDGQVEPKDLNGFLREASATSEIRRLGHDVKDAWKGLTDAFAGDFDDVMLMSYALDNGRMRHDLEGLSTALLAHSLPPIDSALGSKTGFVAMMPAKTGPIMAERADVVLRVAAVLRVRLEGPELKVYETLERPMVAVLRGMEDAGVVVDAELLADLSKEFAQRAAVSEADAHRLAGGPFQISSPKQVGDVLFDRLGLPGGQKTPTGQWQTKANILDELAADGHPVAQSILDWRQVTKLDNTYAIPLRQKRDKKTGRVRTSFGLAATPTARLVSIEPNLQNIPIRTADGRRIRQAFVADAGRVLISADYSQVELRILAQMANEQALQDAFNEGVDIHALTASEMFGVPIEGMPSEIRRRAKAINFGIVYGITGFGLSRQLGIPVGEANDYIDKYFRRFPGIKEYMVEVLEGLVANGYVENLFGRRIHFPHYAASKGGEKGNIERAAINAPIQSSASDIIRRAMIRMPGALHRAEVDAEMLLQVHDELLFDVAEAQDESALRVIVDVMQSACSPDVNLSIPLLVEATAAKNWDAAH